MTKKKLFYLVLIVFVLAGIFILKQYISYKVTKEKLQMHRMQRTKELTMLKAASGKLKELQQEMASIDANYSSGRKQVPEKLDINAFRVKLETWAEGSGVTLHDISVKQTRKEFLDEGKIDFLMKGSDSDMEKLLARRSEFDRLMVWTMEKDVAGGKEVSLKIYALPMDDWAPKAGIRTSESRRLAEDKQWLWPFSGVLETMRTELYDTCVEIDRLGEVAGKTGLLEHKKMKWEKLRVVIDHLQQQNN